MAWTAACFLVLWIAVSLLRFNATVRISGTVLAPDEAPIPNAVITVRFDPSVYPDHAAVLFTSDKVGSFVIDGCLPRRGQSRVQLRVEASGYIPAEKSFPIPAFVYDTIRLTPVTALAL